MPILKLIDGSPELLLTPRDIEALVEAFDTTLLALKIDRAGPEAAWVAKQVIAVAKLGERDPAQIRELVVASIRARRPKRAESPGRFVPPFLPPAELNHSEDD